MKRTLLLLALALGGTASAEVRVDGQTVRVLSGEQVTWQWTFAPALGQVSRPVRLDNQNYVAVGPVVYALSDEGRVLGRADLPGPVTSLDSSGGAVRVTVGGAGRSERLTLGDPTGDALPVEERVVFTPDPAVTGWLARFADALPAQELTRAGAQFPANPFIALREAEAAKTRGDDYAALSAVRRALGVSVPFPAGTQLAARLDRAGFPAAANLALDRAKRDAAARGLDPAVPVSRAALFAYGNPSGYVGTLLAQNRLPRAEVWMSFLRELYPRFEGGDALYRRYADVLDAQGRAGEAEEWRQFARSLREGTLYNLGPNDTRVLRDVARLATFALLLALLAAVLTLSARAWPTQRQDLAALGGRWRSWRRPPQRLRRTALAYASFSERLLLVTLAAALLTALGGWQWANLTGRALQAPALGTGTYSASLALPSTGDADPQPVAATYLLSGLGAQLDGDLAAARTLYGRAGDDACALNNLGAIAQSRDDLPQARTLYQQALALQPDLSAPAYNLGRNPATPETAFQRTYRPGQPRLCYPERRPRPQRERRPRQRAAADGDRPARLPDRAPPRHPAELGAARRAAADRRPAGAAAHSARRFRWATGAARRVPAARRAVSRCGAARQRLGRRAARRLGRSGRRAARPLAAFSCLAPSDGGGSECAVAGPRRPVCAERAGPAAHRGRARPAATAA